MLAKGISKYHERPTKSPYELRDKTFFSKGIPKVAIKTQEERKGNIVEQFSAMSVMIILVLLHTMFHRALTDLTINERRQNSVEFWVDAICRARATKMINLYGVVANESAFLLSFLDELARGINEECEMAIFLTTYAIDEPDKERTRYNASSLWRSEFIEHTLRKTSAKCHEDARARRKKKTERKEKKIFDIWSLHVILVKDERSMEEILNGKASVHWMPRQHFIVLIISNDAVSIKSDEYERTIEQILKSIWRIRQILNVVLFVPFAENGQGLMYAYDPFAGAANNNNDERGKVESINVVSKDDIFQRLSTLTHHRTNDMHGYKLNVALFEQFQSLMKLKITPPKGSIFEYSGGYYGIDGIILGTIAKYMNFRVKVIEPSDNIKYGHELEDGTYAGTLGRDTVKYGDVVHGRADVAFVSFFVKSYGKSKHSFEFTSHTEFDSICVFVPKARKIPKWLRIHHMFEPSIWFCSIISPIIVYLMCLVLRLFTTRRTKGTDHGKLAYKVFQFTVGYPAKLPYSNPERILLFTLSILNVTIAGLFGGLLYKSLAHDMYYKDIDRLVDLKASRLPIIFTKYNLNDVFGDDPSGSPLFAKLKKKLKYGSRAMEDAIEFRNASGFFRKKHYYLIRREVVDEEGSPKLHLVKECPGTYYLGYPVAKNSYLLEKLNLLIGRLDEAGLLTLWTNRTITHLIYRRGVAPKKIAAHSADIFVPFRLTDMQTAFYLLTTGLVLSLLIFCDERGCLRRHTRRKKVSFLRETRRL